MTALDAKVSIAAFLTLLGLSERFGRRARERKAVDGAALIFVAMMLALVLPGGAAVFGGEGDDIVDDGPHFDGASDEISGGPGDDTMDAFNDPATSDAVHCGPGDDVAYVDGTDLVSDDCEKTVLGSHPDALDDEPFHPAPFAN